MNDDWTNTCPDYGIRAVPAKAGSPTSIPLPQRWTRYLPVFFYDADQWPGTEFTVSETILPAVVMFGALAPPNPSPYLVLALARMSHQPVHRSRERR